MNFKQMILCVMRGSISLPNQYRQGIHFRDESLIIRWGWGRVRLGGGGGSEIFGDLLGESEINNPWSRGS